MDNETRVVLAQDGIYRQTVTNQLVGKVEDILAEVAATVPTDIPGVFAGPHKTRVHMRATRTRLTLFCALRHLILNTIWRPYGEGSKQVFPFGSKAETTDFGATYQWVPPENMFLFYVFTTEKAEGRWKAGAVYMVATCKGDKKFYRMPLNNIHDDGRICMGSGYQLNGSTLSEQFANSLAFFESSPWNTDLANTNRIENTRAMFSFDLKGKQKPVEGEWQKQCYAVNNANYSDLPGLIVTT